MFITKVYAIGGQGADKLEELDDIIVNLFKIIWPFIGVVLLFMFISGGIMWLMSEGDPQRLQKAFATMMWAVIGAIIIAAIGLILGVFNYLFEPIIDLVNPGNIF